MEENGYNNKFMTDAADPAEGKDGWGGTVRGGPDETDPLYIRTCGSLKTHINAFATECHRRSSEAGWWKDNIANNGLDFEDSPYFPFVVASKLMLAVSEISEAMEGHRKGKMDDHLPHRPMIEVEIADAFIRLGDLAAKLRLDVGGAIEEKMNYNQHRADHKLENRAAAGGKSY